MDTRTCLHNVIFSSGAFHSLSICVKIVLLCQMAANIVPESEVTPRTDSDFAWFYVAARGIDLLLLLRVLLNHRRGTGFPGTDTATAAAAAGSTGQGESHRQQENVSLMLLTTALGVLLELIMWSIANLAFSGNVRVTAWAVAHVVTLFFVRPLAHSLYSSLMDVNVESENFHIDFKHFRERNSLLIILVLGEVVVTCTLSADGVIESRFRRSNGRGGEEAGHGRFRVSSETGARR